jgi:hypothetical protein
VRKVEIVGDCLMVCLLGRRQSEKPNARMRKIITGLQIWTRGITVRLGNFVDPKYTVGAGILKTYLKE